jgi:hypothetical protein
MTTTVTIKTVDGDKESSYMVAVGDVAQKHVLRSFNVTADAKVDATKVLCAAIIQMMIDMRDAPGASGPTKRAASIAITQCEALQMQAVKANFVQA